MIDHKIAEAMSKKSSKQQSIVLEEDPFALEMMVVPLPRDFEQPKMEKYDGTSNPIDHLRAFVDLMRLRVTPDAIMYRAFRPSLRQEFAVYFSSNKRAKKTTIGLMQLTKDNDELLKDFIVQFNRDHPEIKDLQMSTVVTVMMSRTQSHPFKMSLSMNQSDTMH
ncbi:Retrotransposon gag protein [Abeliophyllum distichum]|uniref:Retrotransposon gag protein n=1 Tax=Abeliophyllum distichum TaxID=126358 RepID=A0ABD1SBG1_9LAMI